MKRIIALSLFIISAFVFSASTVADDPSETIVFICTGASSQCYHRIETCRGLHFCSGEIREMTVSSAQSLGRRECKICHK